MQVLAIVTIKLSEVVYVAEDMQNCETSPGPPSEAICGRDFVKDIEPQRIYIKLQFSRVASILQPSRGRVSEEIQAICQFFA